MKDVIISTTYAGPISYYASIFTLKNVMVEHHEHFEKQSYRNRCTIYGPNGILNLIIPVKKNKSRTAISEVEIANEHQWQKLHWRTLCASYRSSPYFEYYEHELIPFYNETYDQLFEFNQQLTQFLLDKLDMTISFGKNASFEKNMNDVQDYRHLASAKSELFSSDTFTAYPQVFEERNGFMANLSIFDLLFNLGPESRSYLQRINNQLL